MFVRKEIYKIMPNEGTMLNGEQLGDNIVALNWVDKNTSKNVTEVYNMVIKVNESDRYICCDNLVYKKDENKIIEITNKNVKWIPFNQKSLRKEFNLSDSKSASAGLIGMLSAVLTGSGLVLLTVGTTGAGMPFTIIGATLLAMSLPIHTHIVIYLNKADKLEHRLKEAWDILDNETEQSKDNFTTPNPLGLNA